MGVAVDFGGVGVGVHRQQVAALVLEPGNAVTGVKHHQVGALLWVQIAPHQALGGSLVAESAFHLRLRGVSQVDDVIGVEAEHLEHEAPERIGVAVRIGHFRHALVLVASVADDDRHAVGVGDPPRTRGTPIAAARSAAPNALA